VDTKGFHATYVLLPDDDDRTVIAAVVFDDPTTYSANAHDPATEEWYGRFRALLEDDPRVDRRRMGLVPTHPLACRHTRREG
jgi:hypothetical protein